ncbi:hypothetical protein [Mesobacillus zeae]|uniref:hypothetical protein n=1 Tax=Mesobacillus zeae TaxID=1917180 RepID=UPI00115E570A|nr:hypothetical protein [Mesobacillus zeae]
MAGLILSMAAVAYPIVFHAFTPMLHTVHIVIGFLAHFSLAILSIALSLFFTRELVKSNATRGGALSVFFIVSLVIAVTKAEILKIKLLNWLLPPLHYSLEIMSVGDQITSIPAQVYRQFGWFFIYSLILIAIFIAVVQKRRIR